MALGLGTMLGFELRAGCVPNAERGALLLSPIQIRPQAGLQAISQEPPTPYSTDSLGLGSSLAPPTQSSPCLLTPCLPPLTVHQASVPLVLSPWGCS